MSLWRATLAGLVFAATACTTVRRVQPAGYLAQNSPDVVWVTYDNNVVVPVAEAEIRGDTLRGMRQGTEQRVAIPLGQIQSVRAKIPDKAKTAAHFLEDRDMALNRIASVGLLAGAIATGACMSVQREEPAQ